MKILFDTDIGSDIDDALALLLLLRCPGAELVGVTTVYGCTEIRAKVAKKILLAAGHSAPVVAGLCTPFESPKPVWHTGTEGVGILSEEEREAPLVSMGIGEGADDFIIEAVEAHGSDLVIVSLGALTNIAAALRRRPALREQIASLFFMGGGITYREPLPDSLNPGQVYRAKSSHNVTCDVQAAAEVFDSGIPMTILTNDVTTRLWWDGPPVRSLINTSMAPDAKLVGKLLEVWLDYRSSMFPGRITGTCPHDPLTVAEAVQPGFVTYATGKMTIRRDCGTEFVPDENGPHRAGWKVERDAFLEWFSRKLILRACCTRNRPDRSD